MESSVKQPFHRDILKLDPEAVCEQICSKLNQDIMRVLRRRGAVVGISGGIDSSVTMALTARAIGAKRVLGLIMPESDSDPESQKLAQTLADQFSVKTVVENMTPVLEGFDCYRRRDEAIKRLFPEFDSRTYKMKIGLPQDILERDALNVFSVTIIGPDGHEQSKRLPPAEYLQIVAASNFKQRSRMTMLYYHAETNNYAVVGTPNKHEYCQGFFVKFGDGGADVMPIIPFYKTQVYQLARYLGVPESIVQRPPTTDTYSAGSTQEEFFFQLPFELMDLLWYGFENEYPPAEVGAALDMTEEQVNRAYQNFQRKKNTTDYLRMLPIIDYESGF
jgi:NAD+ synthase